MLRFLIALVFILHKICEGEMDSKIVIKINKKYFDVVATEEDNDAWVDMERADKYRFSEVYQPRYKDEITLLFRPGKELFVWQVPLYFYIIFYGYPSDTVWVSSKGFICLEKYGARNCYNYVAPLMANWLYADDSWIGCISSNGSVTIQWTNLRLVPKNEANAMTVSMQVTVNEKGSIKFLYRIASNEKSLRPNLIRIGTSDSMLAYVLGSRREMYGTVELRNYFHDIAKLNALVIQMHPLPTCNYFTDCVSCNAPENNKNFQKMNSFIAMKDNERFNEKTELGATPLMLAAKNKDLKSCLALVEKGQDPEATTDFGVSLLHFAAVNMRHGLEIISHFLGHGLDLSEAKDVDGEEPVLYAIRVGDFNLAKNILKLQNGETNLLLFFVARNNLKIVKIIHADDPELIKKQDAKGNSALHLAAEFADLKMCKWIIKKGSQHVKSLKHVLHRAVLNVNHGMELVRYFAIRLKLDLNAMNEYEETSLHLALWAGNTEMAQLLLDLGFKVDKCDKNLLLHCVKRNNIKSARFVQSNNHSLIKERDFCGRNALHIAAECADLEMCEWLIEQCLDAKTLVPIGGTSALHHVGYNKQYGTELVGYFISLGLEINPPNKALNTPLYVALRNQNMAVAEEMVKFGADFRVKSGRFNLLHYSVIGNNLKSVQFLHSKDPKLVTQLTLLGENALHLAAKHADREMCLFLCEEAGVNPFSSNEMNNNVLHLAAANEKHGAELVEFFATEKGVDVHQRNVFLEIPLHRALDEQNLAIAEALLKAGADINVKLAENSLLHFCASQKKLQSARFVLEKNKDMINAIGSNRMTALHVAAKLGQLEFCKFLVEQGIDFNAEDSFNNTALTYMFSDELLNNLWIAAFILFVSIALIAVIVELIFHGFFNDRSTKEVDMSERYRWDSPFMGLADIDRFMQKTMGNRAGINWLMLAARDRNLQTCLELVKKGENAKATTHFGVTLLHFAALNKRHAEKIASHFVDQGLDLLKKDVDGESPIYYAVRLQQFEDAEKLLGLRSAGIKNLLHYFVAEDKLEIVKRIHSWNEKLIRAVDPEGKNALHFAALCSDLRMCQWLIEKGLDPKSLSAEKMSVLHHAVLNSRHGKELVQFFASLDVDVNGEMEKGETPLHGALFAENLDVARTLLHLGAKLNKSKNNIMIFCVMANKLISAQFVHRRDKNLLKNYVDSKGQTALHVAAACADEKMCTWLVRVGVSAESPESTVLHRVGYNAAHGSKLTPFFVNMGLDLNERDESGKTPIVHALRAGNLALAETMLDLGADLEVKVGGFNLVHLFLICNNMKAVRYLHRKNKQMVKEILSPQGTNAMHLAATFGDLEMCSWLCKLGFDVRDIASHFRNSVLHFASLNKQFGKSLVPFFVYKGVDVNQRNATSMTPLHFALQKENFEVAEALLKSGADSKVKIERDNLLIFCIRKKLRHSAEFVVEKFAEQIMEAGAEGQTALHVAARIADLEFFRFLIRVGQKKGVVSNPMLVALMCLPPNSEKEMRNHLSSLGEKD
ncbi:serine/threonine-protein phosphatase 6 regulatory ankyrin repeat subunit B-like [Cloeon dipterum]|uniref:serine/threonine-protein phosphatase 6 regulatory ankyrin repeat subunit B-like n=1 Tax=Cloeon dipterum TaxID=197152 RepID=UPI003220518B